MSGPLGSVSPSRHSAAFAAANAGAAASAVGSAPPANAIAISQRAASSTTPISTMFPGLAGNPTYVAGESEIPFYENLRAQHASPLEHMAEFHDKIHKYLTDATKEILANNSAHATKIDALRAELDGFQTAETLDLPHVLYLSLKIAALCSDFGDESLSFFVNVLQPYFPVTFLKKYVDNDADLADFTFEKYASEVPEDKKQVCLDIDLPIWPVPFFGAHAEFGITTFNDMLSKGCFPIGHPTIPGKPDGIPATQLGFAGHDYSHWSQIQVSSQINATPRLDLVVKLASMCHDLSVRESDPQKLKRIQVAIFFLLHEGVGGYGIEPLLPDNSKMFNETYLQDEQQIRHLLQQIFSGLHEQLNNTNIIKSFVDAGTPEDLTPEDYPGLPEESPLHHSIVFRLADFLHKPAS